MFFGFIILGALLIVNMLIAMMGNTYNTVAETEKEWTRQVTTFQAPGARMSSESIWALWAVDPPVTAATIRTRRSSRINEVAGLTGFPDNKLPGCRPDGTRKVTVITW